MAILPSVRQHVPLLGRQTGVTIARLPRGSRIKPIEQILYIGGSLGTVTIDDVPAGNENFVVVITVTDFTVGTYTYTFPATVANTKKEIAYQLMERINLGTPLHGCVAQMLRQTVSGNDWVFDIYKGAGATFVLANTGTTTIGSLDVSAVVTGSTVIAKNATSITLLSPVRGIIAKGQYLQFVEPDGDERLIKLTESVASGTTLVVAALAEGISSGSQAIYPVELYDRTQADSSKSFQISDFQTNNTGGKTDGVVTGSTTTGSANGNFYEFCPGYNTFIETSDAGEEVFLSIINPPPKEGWNGRVLEGACLLSQASQGRPTAGFITNNLSFTFLNPEPETPAAPIA